MYSIISARPLTSILAFLIALCITGCGGDSSKSNGDRYDLTITGASLESMVPPSGQATIKRVALRLDDELIADQSFSPPTPLGFIGSIHNIRRGGGRHTLEFRLLEQTVASSTYSVGIGGFLHIRDTESTYTKIVYFHQDGSILTPKTATLLSGQGIKIDFEIP